MDWWIKLHRKLLEWEWYDDINTKVLFIHLILKANHKPWKWRWQEIKIWETLTWRIKLSKETWLTEQQIRTSLNKLKSTNEITIKSTNKNSIITINKWNDYQQNNQQTTKTATNNQQTSNHKQECNNKKNNNNFNDFWILFPNKKWKYKAEDIYKKIDNETHQLILKWLNKEIEYRKQKQARWEWLPNWKHPTTWLNAKSREDEFEEDEWLSEQELRDRETLKLIERMEKIWIEKFLVKND